MENILEIKGLKKEYKDFSLHDISFSLPMDCTTPSPARYAPP